MDILKPLRGSRRWVKEKLGLRQPRLRKLPGTLLALPFSYTMKPQREIALKVAVVLHLFHADLAEEFEGYLKNLNRPADLFISTDSAEKRRSIQHVFSGWREGEVQIKTLPNKGRDIGPKIVGFADVYARYDLVLFLHSKKSTHKSEASGWRNHLLETLVGSDEIVQSIFEIFDADPAVGLVAPKHHHFLRQQLLWLENFETAKNLATRMGFEVRSRKAIDFPSGSMFWMRTAALRPMLDLKLTLDDFPEEQGQLDGTTAHAIERLFCFVVEKAGYRWVKIRVPSLGADKPRLLQVNSRADLIQVLQTDKSSLLREHKSR